MTEFFGPTIPRENVSFVSYDRATGEVISSGHTAAYSFHVMAQQIPGLLIGVGAHGKSYVDLDSMTVHDKEPFPGKLDGLALTGLPVPCTVQVGLCVEDSGGPRMLYDPSGIYDVPDGTVELSFSYPGRYVVRVTSLRYLTAEFVVDA